MRNLILIAVTILSVAFAGCTGSGGEPCGPIDDLSDNAGSGRELEFVCIEGEVDMVEETRHSFDVANETTRLEILHHIEGNGTIALSIIDPQGRERELPNDGVFVAGNEGTPGHLFTATDPDDPVPGEWTLVVEDESRCCVTYHLAVLISSPAD